MSPPRRLLVSNSDRAYNIGSRLSLIHILRVAVYVRAFRLHCPEVAASLRYHHKLID